MDSDKFLTDKQEENVYYANENNSTEQIQEQIRSFINELYKRRRDDYEDEGLQASMIIMPHAFASMITENDGRNPHGITNINLLRHIKGEKTYYIRDAGQYFGIVKNEKNEIDRNGIEIRIIDSEEKLGTYIQTENDIQTKFQLNVLRNLIEELWKVKQRDLYKYIEAGFYSPLSEIDVEELTDNYNELIKTIENEKKELERRKILDEEER